MRIALLTLEALPNARAVRRFVSAHAADVVLVGFSDPFRPEAGGAAGQVWRHLRRSGPRLLPYLLANFALPEWAGLIRRSRPGDVDGTPLADLCRARAVPTATVSDVNGPAFRQMLAASGAELLLTFHFDQILSADTIASVPLGGINVHPGLLPRHRGPVPTIHALLDDPVALGVSVHRLAARIDAGALLAQATLPDRPGLTATEASRLLHDAALPLLDAVLSDVAAARSAGTDPAAGTDLPTLPYRGFPSPDEMRRLSTRGRKAADLADLAAGFRTPVRLPERTAPG